MDHPVSAQLPDPPQLLPVRRACVLRRLQPRQTDKQKHQLLVEHSGKELFHRATDAQDFPPCGQAHKLFLCIVRQEIHRHLHLPLPGGNPLLFQIFQYVVHHTAELEHRNARDSPIRKLQLTPLPGSRSAPVKDSQLRIRPDAGHSLKIILPALKLYQCRDRVHKGMPQPFRQNIPAAVGTRFGRRPSPAGQNHPVKAELLPCSQDSYAPSPPGFLHLFHSAAGHSLHPLCCRLTPQHIKHSRRLVTDRVEPAPSALHHQTHALEKSPRLLPAEMPQKMPQHLRPFGVIVLQSQIFIAQVAPAVSGGQQLSARTVISLQNRHLGSQPGRRHCRRQTGSSAAYDPHSVSHVMTSRSGRCPFLTCIHGYLPSRSSFSRCLALETVKMHSFTVQLE